MHALVGILGIHIDPHLGLMQSSTPAELGQRLVVCFEVLPDHSPDLVVHVFKILRFHGSKLKR